jgi:16S rRNA processing protein RimM
MMQNYFQVGVVTGTHGVNGVLKVIPTTNDPARFGSLCNVYISSNRISSGKFSEADLIRKKVLNARLSGNIVLVTLDDIKTKVDAESLKGMVMLVERKDAVKLDEDEYFIADIIGCSVYDKCIGYIGDLKDVISTGSNDVYIVNGGKIGEVLVPALKEVIMKVSLDARRIDIELPRGLIDD